MIKIQNIKQQLNNEFNQFATQMKLSEYQLAALNLLFNKTVKLIENSEETEKVDFSE